MWFEINFMTTPIAVLLQSRLKLMHDKTSDKSKGKPSSWREVVNHLIETYSTDGVIVETELQTLNFKQLSSMIPSRYTEELRRKALRCNQKYTE